MEIVLTVIGVLVFFGGSYLMGNFLLGFKYDTTPDKVMHSFFGVIVMLLITFLVGFISVGIYEGVVYLIN